MAGFFKKLFNRITGVKEEAQPPAPSETAPAIEEAAPPPVATQEAPGAEEEAPPATAPAGADAPAEPTGSEPVAPEESAPVESSVAPAMVAEPVEAPPPAIEPVVPVAAHVEAEEPKIEAKTKKASTKTKPEPKKPAAKEKEAPKPSRAGAKEKPKPAPAPVAEVSVPVQELPPPPSVPEIPPQPLPPEPAPPPEPVQVPPPAARAGSLVKRAPAVPPPPPAAETAERRGWFSRLKDGLSKSSRSITGSIGSIFTKKKLDAATLQDLEDVLLQADLGLPMAERIIKAVSAGRFDREIDPEEVKRILAEEVAKVLKPVEVPFNFGAEKPFVILVVGVNGSGKTTTIGKLGAIAAQEGYKVMFAACDTFRAAAIEQLTVWGKRIGARTMSRPTGSDASGLAFDAMKAAREDGTDILFIDTAGRLQNKAYLMDELDKVVRVIKKQDPSSPHAVLLVLDATTGQNAMAQAEVFTKVAGVTGLIMTKLDGTARGGILVALAEKFKLPVHAIGVGEQIDDLQPFDAEGFARAIAGLDMK